MDGEIDDVVARWCQATVRRDSAAVADCLSDEVVLSSPISDLLQVRGRAQVRELTARAFSTIESIEFHTRLDGPGHCALFARARLNSQHLDEAVLLGLDEAGGLIREITLFIRPLSALIELNATLTAGRKQR
ncbi:MAG: nuclear transport factor 2 family protein [Jatrophihabitantaceae bacterium]